MLAKHLEINLTFIVYLDVFARGPSGEQLHLNLSDVDNYEKGNLAETPKQIMLSSWKDKRSEDQKSENGTCNLHKNYINSIRSIEIRFEVLKDKIHSKT